MSFNAPIDTQSSQPISDARAYAMLQLQRIGYKVGLIKISDFMRRDEDDELREKLKKDRDLQDWLDAQRFKDFDAKLADFIGENKSKTKQQIDSINHAINRLSARGDKEENAVVIQELQQIKNQLIDHKKELGDIERQRERAKSLNDIKTVANRAETTVNNIQNLQANVHNAYQNIYPPFRNFRSYIYMGTAGMGMGANAGTQAGTNTNSGQSAGAGAQNPSATGNTGNTSSGNTNANTGQNSNNSTQFTAAQMKAALKADLKLLSNETDNHAIENGFLLLNSFHGKSSIESALTELKNDTSNAKYDVMLSAFRQILAKQQGHRPSSP